MKINAKPLTFLAILLALFIVSCGDNGEGCGAPPKKEQGQAGDSGVGGKPAGGGGGGSEIIISDKKDKSGRRVPKPYQRPADAPATNSQNPPAQTNPPAASTASAVAFTKPSLPVARVTRRKVDGISNRVEVKCRIMAASMDGDCASASNFGEIKERCCPNGTIEHCKVSMRGVVLIGLDCEKGLAR